MRHLMLMLLAVILIGASGCARVSVTRVLPDGTECLYEYVRWGNQGIEGFSLTSPDGWTITFDRQVSDFEFAFNLGVISAQVGGAN